MRRGGFEEATQPETTQSNQDTAGCWLGWFCQNGLESPDTCKVPKTGDWDLLGRRAIQVSGFWNLFYLSLRPVSLCYFSVHIFSAPSVFLYICSQPCPPPGWNSDSTLRISLLGHTVPSTPTAPYPPSPVEAKYYFYGLYSNPHLIARSSTDVWVEPRGVEAYLTPKELSPLGFSHALQGLWEPVIGPAIASYLSLDPVRIRHPDDTSPPAILWVGVLPSSIAAEDGIAITVQCKTILSSHGIHDVHVELRESEVLRFS